MKLILKMILLLIMILIIILKIIITIDLYHMTLYIKILKNKKIQKIITMPWILYKIIMSSLDSINIDIQIIPHCSLIKKIKFYKKEWKICKIYSNWKIVLKSCEIKKKWDFWTVILILFF